MAPLLQLPPRGQPPRPPRTEHGNGLQHASFLYIVCGASQREVYGGGFLRANQGLPSGCKAWRGARIRAPHLTMGRCLLRWVTGYSEVSPSVTQRCYLRSHLGIQCNITTSFVAHRVPHTGTAVNASVAPSFHCEVCAQCVRTGTLELLARLTVPRGIDGGNTDLYTTAPNAPRPETSRSRRQ